eukprot:7384298-Prymnesium_polylepis.1
MSPGQGACHAKHTNAARQDIDSLRLRGGGGEGCQVIFRDGFRELQEVRGKDSIADDLLLPAHEFGEYRIRSAKIHDAAALAALDNLSWPLPLRGFTHDEISARIMRFALGTFVLINRAGDVVGSLYTQRITSIDRLSSVTNFRKALDLHDDAGPVWQLLSVQVHPSLSSRGLGDVIINHALTVARATAGVHSVVAVTRCRTWGDAVRRRPAL